MGGKPSGLLDLLTSKSIKTSFIAHFDMMKIVKVDFGFCVSGTGLGFRRKKTEWKSELMKLSFSFID